ncbi:unnamed protein product, partial [Schistocephalus solidus]|uniref:Mucin-5AC n=1 Tax=Schistocephalus solidus TaxID=70667 RepID=A0A183T6K8_SCHSO
MVTSQPNENLPSMDAATRSSEFPAVTLQALGVSNSNADTVAKSGCLRLLTASGDRVPSELARRASELLAEAEDSASVDDNGPHNGRGRKRSTLRGHTRPRKQTGGRALAADATNAVDRTVRGRRLPSPPHLNGPPPAPSAPRVANSLSPGGDPIQTQHDPQNVSCSSQPQSTPLDKNGAADSGGNSVGRSSIYLTKDARTVAELKQQRATETAAVSVAGTTARNVIGDDKINSLLSGDNVDHRKYLAALSARHHAHFSSRADPCTEEALCKARLSANRTRRLLSLSCAPREAVGEAAASDSDSPFTPSTDEETLGTLPGGDDDRWFCLEASSDEVGSADEEAAVVSDQLYSAAAATKPRHHPCYTSRPAVRVSGHSVGKKNGDVETTRNGDFQFEPDPLRFMSVYRQKCRLAAHSPDLTAHVSCKPHTEVSIEDTNMASEIATHRPSLRTLGDPTMNVNHTQLASITSTPLAGTILVKSSQNSTAISAISTSKSQSTLGAKNTRITRLPPAPTGPPRLTAAALGLSLTANVNRLDALAASIEQLQGMESLRQLSLAQAESVSLAQLIQCGQVKESFGINQPTCTHSRPSDLIPSNKNHRTVKEEDSGPVGLQTRKSAAVASSSRGSSQNESSAAVISTSISTHHTSNPSSSRILEISQTARTSSVQDSTLRTSSANGSVVLESTVGAVSEAVQSVAEISNSRLDLGISARTSLQTSVIFPETESKERNSQSTHHTFPKAFDRPFHADKSLNTTNDLLTAIEALDQPIGETSKPPTLAKVEKAVDVSEPGGQILRLNSEDYKGLYKMRAEELKRRKHKAQLVMLLSERLALQESEVVQLESKALQSLRRKLAEPPKLTPPLVGKGEVRTPVCRKRAAVSHKQRETLQGDSTEPEEEESVSGSAVVSSDRLKLPLSVDQGEEGTSVSVSVTVAAAAATASITTSTTASSLVSMSSAASVANDYATTARSRSGGSLPKVSARSATSANDTAVPSPRANILSARDLSLMTTVDATGQDTAGTARTMAPATYSTASFIEESSSDRPHEHIIDLHSSTSARTLTPGFEAGVVISARTLSPLPSGDKNSTGGVSEPPQPRPTGSGDELSADSLEPEVSTASGLSHRERRISAVGAGASEGDSSTAVATGSSASLRHRRHRREKESRLRARSEMEVGNGGDCEWRSQLYAMIDNLVKQERLLARLDRSGSGGNKHELKRLAKTLSKHRQMCTQIIERIHGDLIAHYSRESVITGDDGSYTSLSQRPFLDDPCASNMVLSPSALLAEVVVSTASRSSKRLSQPATVVAGSAVASPQRDHLVERVSTTASIVDVCPIPPASAEAELLSLSAGSHHSGEEQETAESPTSMLSEYSVSIDDQTPSVSRPQTTMSKMPSYRTSPEDLESKSESRLAATTTTHTTAPTPALVDAGVNTPSPRIDSSRHRVLELTTPLTSAANDQKEADIVSDTLYQGILEETPRDSVKLSTPPPSSRSTSTADLPVSEAEVLDRPPSSVSAQSALPPPNELRVSRPQSATGLSMRNDSQGGASSVTPAVSSPRIKSAGSELGSSNLSPAETLGSRSELASPRGHAAEDGVPIDLEAGKLSTTDKFSTKTETPEGTDDVATVLSTPSDHMLAYDTVSTKDQAPAASRIDMESPNSSESSRRSAEVSAAEKGSKVASPAVFSPELQNHADTAVEKQPAL